MDKEIPKHVGIILDGNRRWAQKQGLDKNEGHRVGLFETLDAIGRAARERGIEFLTVYALSLKNIHERSQDEIEYLYTLFEEACNSLLLQFHEENVRIRFIGNLSQLPRIIQEKARDFELLTCYNTGLTFTVAFAYDGQDEIVRAVQKILEDELQPEEVDAGTFAQYLDAAGLPPVDLIIRTGGKQRISGFLLWHGSYAEHWYTEKLWPEFSEADLDEALAWHREQQRNFGK